MKFDKITQLRFLILDWCLSDKEHKYTYEELTEKMGEALFGDSSFSILPNLFDKRFFILGEIGLRILFYKMQGFGPAYRHAQAATYTTVEIDLCLFPGIVH